jgi:hypothetical protein
MTRAPEAAGTSRAHKRGQALPLVLGLRRAFGEAERSGVDVHRLELQIILTKQDV